MFRSKYRYVFVIFLAAYSLGNILLVIGDKLFEFPIPNTSLFLLLLAVVLVIWELNRFVEISEDRLQRFVERRIHPLIILFLASQVGSAVAAAAGLMVLYMALGHDPAWNTGHFKLVAAFAFRVNLFLNCVNAIYFFMQKSRKAEVRAEQFKKDSIEARFEALRSQINPHFLFNCLSALSNLVYKDADTSAKFITQLSNVYRYLLFSQERKIVSLHEELEFMDSYLFLLKIRFGENISIEKNITTDIRHFYIAPATLQMLIENAIKHNVVSGRSPLRIHIVSINESITVTNNLQEKHVKEPSTHVGLKNIIKRYQFLSDKSVEITRTAYDFIVKVPLLQVEHS
jgi:two-component system, LytTR family, sensor kinase